jgi:hypothetical protein
MKKLLFIILIIILFIGFVSYQNFNYKAVISDLVEKDDLHGGELKYNAYLLSVIPVAEASIGIEKEEEYKGRKVYHLTATVKNMDYLSKAFNGYAILDSYMDLEQMNVVAFKQKIVVTGKQDMYREATYDQEKGIMNIGGVQRQIFPNTQDQLSLVANIRRMDLDKTKDIEFAVNTNQKNYIFKGTVEPKDIMIKGKSYRVYLVRSTIRRKDKNPYHKSNIDIVLLKNGNDNTPVLIKVFAGGFLISAKLVEIK